MDSEEVKVRKASLQPLIEQKEKLKDVVDGLIGFNQVVLNDENMGDDNMDDDNISAIIIQMEGATRR